MDDKDLYSGLIRLHIVHHAAHEPVFGLGIIEGLAQNGYASSPGTLDRCFMGSSWSDRPLR